MSFDKPDAPTPPDPTKTANAQWDFTKNALGYTSGLNAPNIYSPFGNVTYDKDASGDKKPDAPADVKKDEKKGDKKDDDEEEKGEKADEATIRGIKKAAKYIAENLAPSKVAKLFHPLLHKAGECQCCGLAESTGTKAFYEGEMTTLRTANAKLAEENTALVTLTQEMAKGMNRSILNIVAGGFGGDAAGGIDAINAVLHQRRAALSDPPLRAPPKERP